MRFRKDAKLDRSQVEDYRGRRMGGGTPMALGGGGIVTILIVLAVVLLGGNLGGGGGLGGLGDLAGQSAGTAAPGATLDHCQSGQDANEHEDCFLLGVVNSVQDYWSTAFRGYEPATTRFFDGSISTACGAATSAVGPFYCPGDRHVYIDLGFFDELYARAPGVLDERVSPKSWIVGDRRRDLRPRTFERLKLGADITGRQREVIDGRPRATSALAEFRFDVDTQGRGPGESRPEAKFLPLD